MAEADRLREWALTTVPAPAPAATPAQIARHLEFMHAALPSRAIDAEAGQKRVAVYASILAGKSNTALAFMARRACETLEWFPTPSQCLAILAEYRPPEPAQVAALLACDQVRSKLFGEWLADLRGGAPIGDVPEQWKRIAVEQGDVRRLDDGSFVSRRLYFGPPRPAHRPPPRELYVKIPNAPPSACVQLPKIAADPGASEGLTV